MFSRSSWCLFIFTGLALILVSSTAACANTTPIESEAPSLKVVPPAIKPGEAVKISTQLKNVGNIPETRTVELAIDGVKTQTTVVKLAPGRTETITFTVFNDKPGIYNIEVNGLSGTFRVVKPAEFTVSHLLVTPHIAKAKQVVTVTADVSNTGEVEGNYSLALLVNGRKVETRELTVAPGVTKKVSFTLAKDTPGSHNIELGGMSGSLTVTESESILAILNANYSELCEELLKLPDLKAMDARDKNAIENIAYLALNPKNKPAFESMLAEGIKDKRKYCTPLEALLWISYDREFDGTNPLQDYSTEKLVNDAWKNTTMSKNYTSERWRDFSEVIRRLNSPRLVALYMKSNIRAVPEPAGQDIHQSAVETFNRKEGDCEDHAMFAASCLDVNGYKSYVLGVRYDINQSGHIVCLYNENERFFFTGDTQSLGTVKGPYSTIEEASKAIYSDWVIYNLFNLNWEIIETRRRG